MKSKMKIFGIITLLVISTSVVFTGCGIVDGSEISAQTTPYVQEIEAPSQSTVNESSSPHISDEVAELPSNQDYDEDDWLNGLPWWNWRLAWLNKDYSTYTYVELRAELDRLIDVEHEHEPPTEQPWSWPLDNDHIRAIIMEMLNHRESLEDFNETDGYIHREMPNSDWLYVGPVLSDGTMNCRVVTLLATPYHERLIFAQVFNDETLETVFIHKTILEGGTWGRLLHFDFIRDGDKSYIVTVTEEWDFASYPVPVYYDYEIITHDISDLSNSVAEPLKEEVSHGVWSVTSHSYLEWNTSRIVISFDDRELWEAAMFDERYWPDVWKEELWYGVERTDRYSINDFSLIGNRLTITLRNEEKSRLIMTLNEGIWEVTEIT